MLADDMHVKRTQDLPKNVQHMRRCRWQKLRKVNGLQEWPTQEMVWHSSLDQQAIGSNISEHAWFWGFFLTQTQSGAHQAKRLLHYRPGQLGLTKSERQTFGNVFKKWEKAATCMVVYEAAGWLWWRALHTRGQQEAAEQTLGWCWYPVCWSSARRQTISTATLQPLPYFTGVQHSNTTDEIPPPPRPP